MPVLCHCPWTQNAENSNNLCKVSGLTPKGIWEKLFGIGKKCRFCWYQWGHHVFLDYQEPMVFISEQSHLLFPFLFHPLWIEEIFVDPIFLRRRTRSIKRNACVGGALTVFWQRWVSRPSLHRIRTLGFPVAGKRFCCTILRFVLVILSNSQPACLSRS